MRIVFAGVVDCPQQYLKETTLTMNSLVKLFGWRATVLQGDQPPMTGGSGSNGIYCPVAQDLEQVADQGITMCRQIGNHAVGISLGTMELVINSEMLRVPLVAIEWVADGIWYGMARMALSSSG